LVEEAEASIRVTMVVVSIRVTMVAEGSTQVTMVAEGSTQVIMVIDLHRANVLIKTQNTET
jgi:hypothetical protein